MVLVRCEEHYPDEGRGRNYVAVVEPIGYPNTAAICGREGASHTAAGHVHLDESEYELYKQGQRIFEPHTNATHVRVTDCY